MDQKPYLNLGCGHVILPAPAPAHYALVDAGLTEYALWHNVDRNAAEGVDEVVDIFTYPWPWADNSFDGALLAHIAEHIPHEPKGAFQDGWYAFMHELWRVLTPDAVAHILSPYGWSQGAITDPTHTRLLTEHTFTHSLTPDPNSPFTYATGGLHLDLIDSRFSINKLFANIAHDPEMIQRAMHTQINVAIDIYVKLRAVK